MLRHQGNVSALESRRLEKFGYKFREEFGVGVLLIDTNLWSYLSNETDPDSLALLLSRAGHEAALNSEMLTEALLTSDVDARTRIVEMMCSRHWTKLHANASLIEVVDIVKSLRPRWLRSMPKTARLKSMDDYWTKTFYREAKQDQEAVVSRLRKSAAHQNATTEIARVQRANQAVWPFLDGDLKTPAFLAQTAEDHLDPDPGSKLGWPAGTPVRMWRVLLRDTTWAYLKRETVGRLNGYVDTTYTDTLGAFIDVPSMLRDRESFNTLFLFDADTWDMPRAWWYGTVETLQHAARLANSNGMDAAHASYLPDCDYLLTADQRFHRILAAASEVLDAPRGGTPVLVRPHRGGWVKAVEEALASLPPIRLPKRVRAVHAGGSYVVGVGEGQVSATAARDQARRGPVAEILRGPVSVEGTQGDVVLEGLAAVVTNSEEYRPEGVRSKYFGTLHAPPGAEDAIAALPVGTIYRLRWTEDSAVTTVYLRSIDPLRGIGVFAVNGKARSLTS